MTDSNKTLIAVVMDRSGSMSYVRDATIKGFNEFLQTQKETPGECQMYYTQFNHNYELVHRYINLQDMPEISVETYKPTGNTALWDAIGKTIDQVGADLASIPENERPGRVLFVIQTDGAENASVEYRTLESIKVIIERQQKEFNWDFVFLGANIDAPAVAQSMGMQVGNAMTYSHNDQSTVSAMASIGSNVSAYRSGGGGQSLRFTAKQREDAQS